MLGVPIQPTSVSAYHRCAYFVCQRTAIVFVSEGSKRVKTATLSFKLNYTTQQVPLIVSSYIIQVLIPLSDTKYAKYVKHARYVAKSLGRRNNLPSSSSEGGVDRPPPYPSRPRPGEPVGRRVLACRRGVRAGAWRCCSSAAAVGACVCLDPETVRYLDYDSDRACSAGTGSYATRD